MKISRGFALSCLISLAASPVFAAGFSLGDAANAISGMQGGNNKAAAVAPSSETAGLLSALTSQLNVTPEQAVGGTGALKIGADFLKRYIRDPQSLRHWPQAKMPAFAASVLPDSELALLVAYLKHMAGRKQQP